MRSRNWVWAGLLLAQVGLVRGASASAFTDNFNNGVPADADNDTAFWTTSQAAPPSGTTTGGGLASATETLGKIRLNVGNDTGVNTGVVLDSTVSPNWNPFTQTQTYSLRGVGFNDNSSGASFAQMFFRFALLSEASNSFASNDSIVVTAGGTNGVTLGFKRNSSNTGSNGSTTLVTQTTTTGDAGNFFRGFDLTIGPGTTGQLAYTFTVIGANSNLATQSGSFAFDQASWGTGGTGDAAMMLWGQEGTINSATQNFSATLDSLQVVPEPATLGIAGLAVVGMLLRRRRRSENTMNSRLVRPRT